LKNKRKLKILLRKIMTEPKKFPIIHPMQLNKTSIDGLYFISMKQVEEERGMVREFFRQSAFAEAGLANLKPWKQINATETIQGAIRGLHAESMVKLVAVVAGEAYGVYVDLRPKSATRGNVETIKLVKGTQVLVPKGVGNGFQSVSENGCQYIYCFDEEWVPGMHGYSCCPLDPELNIDWPIPVSKTDTHLISAKDANGPSLAEALKLAEAQGEL
jgi:dTDP-4-dehydrorhamnose 3,5-epimerase